MKTLFTAIAAGLIAGALGAFVVTMNQDASGGDLERSDAERLSALEDRCARLEEDLAEARSRAITRDDLAEAMNAVDLRAELDALRARMAKGDAGANDTPLAAGGSGISDEDDLVERVASALAERRRAEREQKSNERNEKTRTWARARNRNRARAFAKKYELNDDQTERLAEAMNTRETADAELWGTMKGDEATAEDRLDAIRRWRDNRETFERSTRNFMSQDQADEVLGAIQTEEQKVSDWLDGVESELSGGR